MPTNHTLAQTTTITHELAPIAQLSVRLAGEVTARTVLVYGNQRLEVDMRCIVCKAGYICMHARAAEDWWRRTNGQ